MGLIEVLALEIDSIQASIVVMGIGKVGERTGEFSVLLRHKASRHLAQKHGSDVLSLDAGEDS